MVTHIWPFFGVNSQVVIEVMPFPEIHWAVREIAFQNFEISLSFWVLELEYPKLLGGWNMRV